MNSGNFIKLLIGAAIVIVAGFYFYSKQGASYVTGTAGMGDPVIASLDVNKVAEIVIKDSEGEVNLQNSGERWGVQQRDGYPAKFSSISDLLVKLKELTITQIRKEGRSSLGDYQLTEPGDSDNSGTRFRLLDSEGAELASLLLGQEHNRVTSTGSSYGDGRYILTPEQPEDGPVNIAVVKETLDEIKSDASEWLDKDNFIKVEKIKSVAVDHADPAQSWKLARQKEGEDMELIAAKEDEKLDSTKASSAGRDISYARFEDVVPKDTKPEETGMDKPAKATIETFGGLTFVLKLAKASEDHYVSFTVSGDRAIQEDENKPRELGKDEKPEDKEKLDKEHAETQKKLKEDRDKEFGEKLEQQKALAGWTYKVSSYTFDGISKQRSELMEEEEEEEEEDKTSSTEAETTNTSGDAAAQVNKEAGEKFLEENKDKEGVMTTDSGLQYKVIKEGDGSAPAATDTVTVNYKGTLIDGTEFDSGEGISFPLNGVIKGWTEGLQLMKTGGSTRFFIPSGLAYGATGSGPKIGPNAALIFDVDLLSIAGQAKAPKPPTPPAPAQEKRVVTSDIIKVPSAEEMKKGAKIEIIKPEDLPKEIDKEKARQEAEKKDDSQKGEPEKPSVEQTPEKPGE